MAFDRILDSGRETLKSEDKLTGLNVHGPAAGDNVGSREDSSGRGIPGLNDHIRGLDPHQRPGVWVYAELPLMHHALLEAFSR